MFEWLLRCRKYIPSLAAYIHAQNQEHQKLQLHGQVVIQLRGIAIGNGWVHPIVQNEAYVTYPYAFGLIDSYQRDQAELIQQQLKTAIEEEQWISANNLSNSLEAFVLNACGNVDIDDVLFDVNPLNDLIDALTTYLNLPEVRAQLNVGNHSWSFSNDSAGSALDADEQRSVLHLLPPLIAAYRVLIYTGNMDMNCNLMGVEAYLNAMDWPYKKQFYTAPRGLWNVDGKVAGYARTFGQLSTSSLTNLVVRNAGHEVPYFQPQSSLDMFNRFINGQPFF